VTEGQSKERGEMKQETRKKERKNRGTALKLEGHWFGSPLFLRKCFIDLILPIALWLWEYQEYFLGVKAAGA